ncbi:aldo/keto reductase [Variovorax sp. Sphag1AA]|uniref:aldo/keto reductase n=1 Tax=Variovorax sp. Sphag1AA TaxID=2587027 RepID=UPI00160A192B|nr:aldo/keto reductase [Variovorax sp. Sphag1AA]MBB3182242.1 putative repeat protein (TIGR04076 family) [Variovorax sp. Sphag1AA]
MTIETITLAPDYTISRVAKGNWQLATKHSAPYAQDDAIEDMRRFVEAGINAFDCADHYVGVEDIIGAFSRRYPALGRQLRISTKYTPDQEALGKLRRDDVEAAIDTSLQRLGVERLDLVQFHWWDYEIPGYVEAMQWLKELQQEGKIAHLGTTNFDVRRLREITESGVKLLTNQLQYSLLDHRPEHGMVDFCKANDIQLLCYGTLAGGFLSERYLGQPEPTPPYANRSLVKYRLIIEEFGGWEAYQSLLRTLSAVAKKHGSSVSAVAARYVLDKPQVAAALVGAKDASHLDETLAIFRLQLDADDRASIAAHTENAMGPAGDCYDLERIKGGRHAKIMQTNQNTQGAPASVDLAPDVASPQSEHAFTIHDLRVEVVAPDGAKLYCGANVGDYFELRGEMLHLPPGQGFSIYSLGALLPLLAAKQRHIDPNDWMSTDADIACPDPNCPSRFRISRTNPRTFRHADTTAVVHPSSKS